MCTCCILLAMPSICTGSGYAMKHETWNVFDSAVFLPMARYSPSSVSRRWSYRLNAPMRVGSTSQTLTWSKKYRDKTVGGGAAGATLPRRPSRPAMLPVVAAAAAERPAEAMRPASPRCRPRGDALTRREEGQLVGQTTIRRLSGRASAEEGSVRVKPCGKCFTRTGASNLTRATQEGANLPCSQPWPRTRRRSMPNRFRPQVTQCLKGRLVEVRRVHSRLLVLSKGKLESTVGGFV